jgi:twitching motility protein PilT
MDIAELLDFSVKHNASDLHLSAGVPPMVRVDGDVHKLGVPAFAHADVHRLVFDIMNDAQRAEFEEKLETDFSFELPNVGRSRGGRC